MGVMTLRPFDAAKPGLCRGFARFCQPFLA
jgi:hypothetical protein